MVIPKIKLTMLWPLNRSTRILTIISGLRLFCFFPILTFIILIGASTDKKAPQCFTFQNKLSNQTITEYNDELRNLLIASEGFLHIIDLNNSNVHVINLDYCRIVEDLGSPSSCDPHLTRTVRQFKGPPLEPLNVQAHREGFLISLNVDFAVYNQDDSLVIKGDTVITIKNKRIILKLTHNKITNNWIVNGDFGYPYSPRTMINLVDPNSVLYHCSLAYQVMVELSDFDSSYVKQFILLTNQGNNEFTSKEYLKLPCPEFLINRGAFMIGSEFRSTRAKGKIFWSNSIYPVIYSIDTIDNQVLEVNLENVFTDVTKGVFFRFDFTIPDSSIYYNYYLHDMDYYKDQIRMLVSYNSAQYIYYPATDNLHKVNMGDRAEIKPGTKIFLSLDQLVEVDRVRNDSICVRFITP